jgi:hypothetical protein
MPIGNWNYDVVLDLLFSPDLFISKALTTYYIALLIHSLVFSLFFSLFFSYLFFLYGPRQEIPVQQDNWYPENWDNNYIWTEPSYEIGPSEKN